MTCNQTQFILEALAEGKLGWGASRRVRRHLAGCASCAAELAQIQQLDRRVRAWGDVSAPPGLGERIAAALPAAAPRPARLPLPVRRISVGLAGAVAAVSAFFWLLPGQPGHPTIAFADVERAMQQVQSVSYHMNTHIYDAQGRIAPGSLRIDQQVWMRRSSPALALMDAIGHYKSLEDARGYLMYGGSRYMKVPTHENITQNINRYIHNVTEPPTDPQEFRGSRSFHFQPWQRHEGVVDGKPCLVFTQTLRRVVGNGEKVSRITLWVDTQTLHIFRMESVGDPTGEAGNTKPGDVERTVIDNFQYNKNPPPGVFDWSPPPGAKVEGHW